MVGDHSELKKHEKWSFPHRTHAIFSLNRYRSNTFCMILIPKSIQNDVQACLSVGKLKIIGFKKKVCSITMKFHHFRPILVSEPCRNIQKNSAFDCNENFVLPTLFVQSHLQCNNNDASIAGCHEQCAEFLPKFPIKVSLRSPCCVDPRPGTKRCPFLPSVHVWNVILG